MISKGPKWVLLTMSRLLRRLVPQSWGIFFRFRSNWGQFGRFIHKNTTVPFRPFLQKIYLYTSASAFSEILQRLKQNSKTSCDLGKLPTEVGVKILKCLDATGKELTVIAFCKKLTLDLSLASCVWHELGSDWSVWMDLCKRTWRGPARLYSRKPKSWKSLYMLLDEATVQFNADPKWGIALLAQARFLTACSTLKFRPEYALAKNGR